MIATQFDKVATAVSYKRTETNDRVFAYSVAGDA